MNSELLDALSLLEKEKNISKASIIKAIEYSIESALKKEFSISDKDKDSKDNIKVTVDPSTAQITIIQSKTVVKNVENPHVEITKEDAKEYIARPKLGDIVEIEIDPKRFGRILTSAAKNSIIQKIRDEERNLIYEEYIEKEHQVVTGTIQRYFGKSVSINIGKADAILAESEQIKGERYPLMDRIKVYLLEVKDSTKGSKGPKIRVSRTHPELVRCLFEEEVTEVREGIVEIKSIAREAGNRTKIAVYSHDEDVDPVGACVGMNGIRVNNVCLELGNEKIDIIEWDKNSARLIENALAPAKVISVIADDDDKTAEVVVPDDQLSLAIGRAGLNAKLAAKLTGFKIDIKSETQARESGDYLDYEDEYYDEDYDGEGYYDERGEFMSEDVKEGDGE